MNNKTPLVLPAIVWSLGLVIAKIINPSFTYIFLLFIAIFPTVFIKKIRVYSVIFLILLLAILRWQLYTNLLANHIKFVVDNCDNFIQPIEGKIISEVEKAKHGFRFVLKIKKIKNFPVSGNIVFNTVQRDLEYGDEIKCLAKIKRLKDAKNPANFDYKEYLFSKGIYAKGYSKSHIKVIDYKPNFFLKNIIKAKKFIRKRIKRRLYHLADFTKAIIIAEKRNINDWKTALTKSGLSHLLAVSGLHIAIISLIIFTILKIFILNRYILYSLSIVILFCYGFITGWPPSVMRAITMIILYLVAKLLQRKVSPNNILAATLIIVTSIKPNQLFSAGFQMSFLAVLTLFNINILLKTKADNKLVKWLISLLIVMIYSFVLNLFLSPVTMYHFHSLNMNGVISNLFGIPLIGIILPLALLVIFLPYPLYIPFVYSYFFVMNIFEKMVSITAKMPFYTNFIRLDALRFILLLSLIILLFSFKTFFKRFYAKMLLIAVALIIFLFPYKNDGKMQMILFSSKKNGYSLITTPNRKQILLISVKTKDYNKIFKREVIPYLKANAISRLDYVIITEIDREPQKIMVMLNNLKIKKIVVKKDLARYIKEDEKVIPVVDSLVLQADNINFRLFSQDNHLSLEYNYKNFCTIFENDTKQPNGNKDISKIDVVISDKDVQLTGNTILFINSSDRIRNVPKKDKNIFISSKDGAMILKTDGEILEYGTFLSHRKNQVFLSDK